MSHGRGMRPRDRIAGWFASPELRRAMSRALDAQAREMQRQAVQREARQLSSSPVDVTAWAEGERVRRMEMVATDDPDLPFVYRMSTKEDPA